MFRCAQCLRTQPSRTSPVRVPIRTREKVYPYRAKVNRIVDRLGFHHWTDDPGGRGWEIAQEVLLCPPCAPPKEERIP